MILFLHHFVSLCSLQFAIGVSILFQMTLLKAEMQTGRAKRAIPPSAEGKKAESSDKLLIFL